MEVVFRNSEGGPPMSNGGEIVNFAAHGMVEYVVMLPGGAAPPVLAALGYDRKLTLAAHDAFAACLAALPHYPEFCGRKERHRRA